jgi:hypothetical protein
MRVYQCIHKYPAMISRFEAKHGVADDIGFDVLRQLVVSDGYASTYILQPALENRSSEVFYTLWDYERLQWKWAEERGLKTRDLNEIKLAQIEEFRPDVFYNMSAMFDRNFIGRLGKNKNRLDLCWNGIIRRTPQTFPDYDGHLSLHRPYVHYWRGQGLNSLELQPGIPEAWGDLQWAEKEIDVLFYGQYFRGMFETRVGLVEDLLRYKIQSGRDVRCHLTYTEQRRSLGFPGIPRPRLVLPIVAFPSRLVRRHALPPLYGDELYGTIARAKIVVNIYTDENREFKSNMRLFEATGLGAFLVSEEGMYPDGFEPGQDFYTYRNTAELIDQVERVLSDWPRHAEIARRVRQKIANIYSKQRQWNDFKNFASRS